MHRRGRAVLGVSAVLVVAAALEAVCLRANVLGAVVLAAVAALALVVVLVRFDVVRAAHGAALACAFTISWTGWYVGPVRPGDVLAPVALALFVVANPNRATRVPPWWVKQLVVAIVVATLLATLYPADLYYLSHRVVLDAGGMPIPIKGVSAAGNVGVALKYIVAVVVAPMAFVASALLDRSMVARLATAYLLGTTLSGLAGTIDHFHLGDVGRLITGVPNAIDRQAGFTTQPNFLGASLVLAIPFGCWMAASPVRRRSVTGIACLVILFLGVYATGSRGAAVCALLVVIASLAFLPRTRALTPPFVLVALAAGGLVAVALPSLGREVLKVTRLSGNATTSGSDTVRALVGAQGVHDFKHSPIWGIGLNVSTEASQVYLQELASGGLILFTAMLVYNLGAFVASWRLVPRDDLAAAIAGAVFATLVLNFFEADLTDRFYYIPEALLIALMVVVPRDAAPTEPSSAADTPLLLARATT